MLNPIPQKHLTNCLFIINTEIPNGRNPLRSSARQLPRHSPISLIDRRRHLRAHRHIPHEIGSLRIRNGFQKELHRRHRPQHQIPQPYESVQTHVAQKHRKNSPLRTHIMYPVRYTETQVCIKHKKMHTFCNYYNFTLERAI